MRTLELIDLLAKDDLPSRPARWMLPGALAAGFLLALALTFTVLGIRPASVLTSGAVAAKLLFTASLGLLAMPALRRSLQPGAKLRWQRLLPLIAALGIVGAALVQAVLTPVLSVWRPDTPVCLVLIPLFALPGLCLIALAARTQAPTDLPQTGLLAGLVAGALSASAYALHCPNDDPVYLAAWYLPAVLITGLIGRTLGTRLLVW